MEGFRPLLTNWCTIFAARVAPNSKFDGYVLFFIGVLSAYPATRTLTSYGFKNSARRLKKDWYSVATFALPVGNRIGNVISSLRQVPVPTISNQSLIPDRSMADCSAALLMPAYGFGGFSTKFWKNNCYRKWYGWRRWWRGRFSHNPGFFLYKRCFVHLTGRHFVIVYVFELGFPVCRQQGWIVLDQVFKSVFAFQKCLNGFFFP